MNAKKTVLPAEEDRIPIRMRKCLPAETLSAELDGEHHFSPEEYAHLEHCPRCRSLYESYRILDDAVTKALTVNCPRAACSRIRKNVNRKLDAMAPMHTHNPIRFSALAARVAAVMVIAAMAGYLIFIDNPYSDEWKEEISPLPSASAAVQPEPATADSSPAFPGGVDIRNLRLAAAGESSVIRFADPSAVPVKAENAAVIPETVKHVWLFNPPWKTEQVEELFRSVLEGAGIPLRKVFLEGAPKGGLRARLLLTRYQAAVLTRLLAARQLQLMSPSQPQPEQKLFAGTGNETVEYEAVLLPRDQ